MTDKTGARWRDVVLPGVVAVLAVAEMAGLQLRNWGWGATLEVAACAVLVFRRRHALIAATLAMVVLLSIPWVGPPLDEPSVPILLWALSIFSLARWIRGLGGLFGVAIILGTVFADYAFIDRRHHNWSDVIFIAALTVPPYVLGRITRKLAEQTVLLKQQQEIIRRESVRAERDRIARELHDVIAHTISAMVVQTAAAQDLVRADPDRAERVLADVAATGRNALAETGRLLHLIRDDAGELGLQPAPGLARVPELVDQFRDSGLAVELHLDQSLPTLPTTVDISVYRIVQEALTNALKYGADRTAALRLSATSSAFSISASNPSNGATGAGSGLGLLGIAERVSLLGGTLSHGVTKLGRFELAATLPLNPGEQT